VVLNAKRANSTDEQIWGQNAGKPGALPTLARGLGFPIAFQMSPFSLFFRVFGFVAQS